MHPTPIAEDMTLASLFLLQDNEVAAVEPPPVVPYSQDHTANNGAEQISPPHQPIELPRESENRNPSPPETLYPEPQYPPQPDPRYPPNTDSRYDYRYPERYPVTPPRRPNPPVIQAEGHTHTSGPGVSLLNLFTTLNMFRARFLFNDTLFHLFNCAVASYCPKLSTSGQHERHPWGGFHVLPAGSGCGAEGNVQSIPFLQTPGSVQHRSQI